MGGSKFLIVGPAASGKDWLQRKFVEKGYSPLVQYTTRPRRPNEDGNEYHFVSQKTMGDMIRNMKFLSVKCFNTWWYGFTKDDFEKCDVAIVSRGNINEIKYNYKNIINDWNIIYLDIDVDVRINRLKNRYIGGNEDDSISRRVSSDAIDFEDFNDYTIRLTSEKEVADFINNVPAIK